MFGSEPGAAYVLSAVIAVLAFLSFAGGLFTDLHRNNALITAAFRENDLRWSPREARASARRKAPRPERPWGACPTR